MAMTAILIVISIFAAGFGAGYLARARISQKRRERYLMYANRHRLAPDDEPGGIEAASR